MKRERKKERKKRVSQIERERERERKDTEGKCSNLAINFTHPYTHFHSILFYCHSKRRPLKYTFLALLEKFIFITSTESAL